MFQESKTWNKYSQWIRSTFKYISLKKTYFSNKEAMDNNFK